MNESRSPQRRRRRYVTIRDGKAGLPYSKGLMATSIMASGLAPPRAYEVAEAIERSLHDDGRDDVSAAELRDLAYRVLEEEIGEGDAQKYWRWQVAQDRSIPLIVLIGGSTGVGKSTVATTIAHRLGIVRIVSTDAVREVMRGVVTREIMPSLHMSSFEVPSGVREPLTDVHPVLAGFREQVHAVAVGITQIIRRAVVEGTDLIVEGAHVVPGFLDLPSRDEAVVAQQIIAVDDSEIHRSHFIARAKDARSRGYKRYLDHFDEIRMIQEYIKSLAVEHGVPIVRSYSLDATVSSVMELVVREATELPPPAARDRPRASPEAGGPSPGEGASGTRSPSSLQHQQDRQE